MNLTTILFDLDGTLLPMDQNTFIENYFKLLVAKMLPYGYEPKKLIDCVWAGTAAMVQNDGKMTNEDVFWDKFASIYGKDALAHKPVFEDFYKNEFNGAEKFCGHNPAAADTIRSLKEAGYRLILATNPLFPAVATMNRIRWAGLMASDFELVTTYENTSFCKPNPAYYTEILTRLNLRAEECLMVGNDVSEDMIARTLGMKVFLLTDCLINSKNEDIDNYPHGSFAQLADYIYKFV